MKTTILISAFFLFFYTSFVSSQDLPNVISYSLEGDKLNISVNDKVFIDNGKPKVVIATAIQWCPPCQKQVKEVLVPLYEKYKDSLDFIIIECVSTTKINSDEDVEHLEESYSSSWRKAVYRYKYPWEYENTIAAEWEKVIAINLVTKNIPMVNFIDRKGSIIHQQEGYSSGNFDSWEDLFKKAVEYIYDN